MGTKQVTGSSFDGLVEAFAGVLDEHAPTTNTPRDYTVVGWRAQAGGPVKGLVPEIVEQKLRQKLDPAYKLADTQLIEVPRRRKKREGPMLPS